MAITRHTVKRISRVADELTALASKLEEAGMTGAASGALIASEQCHGVSWLIETTLVAKAIAQTAS